jgi:exodeoxyribonuclease VII large subunit
MDAWGVDVMIVGRGGGSIEDLWAFNEEIVARAVYHCKTPVISAVGHETDTTMIDFVSDLRAPTPSAAAELAVPDMRLILEQIQSYEVSLNRHMARAIAWKREQCSHYQQVFRHLNPVYMLTEKRHRLLEAEEKLGLLMEQNMLRAKGRLAVYAQQLNGLSPLRQLERGYAYVTDSEGHGITSMAQVAVGERITVAVTDGEIQADVIEMKKLGRE